MVRNEIEPRLLERTIRQVADGAPAEIIPFSAKGRGRLIVTAEALQPRKMFSKPIPWKTMTEISDGIIEITTVESNGKQRKHNTGFGSPSGMPGRSHSCGITSARGDGCLPRVSPSASGR